MAVVSDYLNMSMSLLLSNRQKTDVEYRLPNDARSVLDKEVASWDVSRQTVPADATNRSFDVGNNATSVFLVFFSHPVAVVEVNNTATAFHTSFFGVWSDRSDGTNSLKLASTDSLKIDNTLHSPNYTSTSGGATTDVEATVVEITLSSTA